MGRCSSAIREDAPGVKRAGLLSRANGVTKVLAKRAFQPFLEKRTGVEWRLRSPFGQALLAALVVELELGNACARKLEQAPPFAQVRCTVKFNAPR